MAKTSIYLDYAAATPIDDAVLAAMQPFFTQDFYNPSANYSKAKLVSNKIDLCRAAVAEILSVKSNEVYFTSGGTEANNLAIKGVLDSFPGKNVVISAIEHESVTDPAKNYKHKFAPVDNKGIVSISELAKLIDKDTVLLSVMYANNEIGSIQPLVKIKNLLNTVRQARKQDNNKTPLYFHTDACQAANYLGLNAAGLGVDLMSLNGGKIYGPKQSGILYVHRSVKLTPQILGGGQEHGMRSGTENVANIVGFAKALEFAQRDRTKQDKNQSELRDYFLGQLKNISSGITINGSAKSCLANNANVTFHDIDNEVLLFKLDQLGIMCSTGSACSAQKDTISPTLLAIGLTEAEALSSIRFTIGKYTTKAELDKTVENIQKILI